MRKPTLVVTVLVAIGFSAIGYLAGWARVDRYHTSTTGASYLFVWAGDADQQDSDFLAVIDAGQSEPTYGQVVATLPVGMHATMPHHTEYEFPSGGTLFANGWAVGRTFLLDLGDPLNPRLVGQFDSVEGYSFPHSFARLPDGHVLGAFQARGARYAPPGGLVELDTRGRGIRAASAATTEIDSTLTWPYSLVVLPEIDRVVTTSSDMGVPPWDEWEYHDTYHVQIWSLSNLRVLATVALPETEQGPYHIAPAEPRVLADGSVYVNTFSCGLYRMEGLASDRPTAAFVYAFPGGLSDGKQCGVPVVHRDYWIQTVPALPGLVALDVSDPMKPVEVSRLVLDEAYSSPHWLAVDRATDRLVVTGDMASWVLIVELDPNTGALTIDETFGDESAGRPGVDFNRTSWPHGETGAAVVHGALFSR